MKRLLTGILAAACAFSLAACSGNSEKDNDSPESSAESAASAVSEIKDDQNKESSSESSKKIKELTVEKIGIDLNKGSTHAVILYENGEKTQNSSYVWKSDKPEIADVSSNGVITANSAGYANVTVSDPKDPTVFAQVNVHVPAEQSETSKENSGSSVTIVNNIPSQQSSEPSQTYVPQVSQYQNTSTTHFNPYLVSDGERAYDYVSREIPLSDLNNFTDEEIQFLLNVIAAKHGYRFTQNGKWTEIFNRYGWYHGIPSSLYTTNSPDVNYRMTPEEKVNNDRLMDRR